MAHSKYTQLFHTNDELTKHSQLMHMTNVLIMHYRHAILSNDSNAKRNIVEAKRTLYKHKKFYHSLERK